VREVTITRQSEFERLRAATVTDGRGWVEAAVAGRRAAAGGARRMAKWQRQGSWFTEGATLLDESTSGINHFMIYKS